MAHGASPGERSATRSGILDVITDEMAEGNAITIAGFGRFEAKEHKGRRVVRLHGEEYEVESRLVPSFHPYACLRQKVQGKTDEADSKTRQGVIGALNVEAVLTVEDGQKVVRGRCRLGEKVYNLRPVECML